MIVSIDENILYDQDYKEKSMSTFQILIYTFVILDYLHQYLYFCLPI